MYIDASLAFGQNMAIGATGYKGDVIDFEEAQDLFGVGNPLFFFVQVRTALAGGTSLGISLRASDELSSGNLGGSSIDTVMGTSTIVTASGTMGTKYFASIPFRSWRPTKRYMQLYFSVSGTFTAGSIDGHLLVEAPRWTALKAEPARIT